MVWWVYILRSVTHDRYYIGQSEDPERRLYFHNTIEKGFTSRYRPWEIVYYRQCETKTEALAFERKIKGWKSKVMLKKLIDGTIRV